MEVITDLNIKNDICDIARLFDTEGQIEINCSFSGNTLYTHIKHDGINYDFTDEIITEDKLEYKRLYKRYVKKHTYDIIKKGYGGVLPWGSLTGIRPVKLYEDAVSDMGQAAADKYFAEFYDVSAQKIALVKEIYSVQKKLPKNIGAQLYVGIPFCKGRCSYCSFFSSDIDKNAGLIDNYINCLIKEITAVKEIADSRNISFDSIYIGGGTPSSLPLNDLQRVISEVKNISVKEFTVEAGRPDSITTKLLDMLKENNVNRISINPQTANDATLIKIGRRHTFEDFINAYDIAKKYDFIINADIIAGLPDESDTDFINTLDKIAQVLPQNITVHTLALKRGAELAIEGYKHGKSVSGMIDYAYKTLHKYGYNAYYMYRQKNTAGNLENAGYSIADTECLYNIYNLNDKSDIIACGADAVSKKVCGNRIERQGNPKDIATYCAKIDDIITAKKAFFV